MMLDPSASDDEMMVDALAGRMLRSGVDEEEEQTLPHEDDDPFWRCEFDGDASSSSSRIREDPELFEDDDAFLAQMRRRARVRTAPW